MVDSQLHVIEACNVVVVCVGMKESRYGLVQLCDLYLFVPGCIVPAAVTQFEEVKKKYIEEYQNVSGQSLLTAVLLLLTHALPAITTITAESLLFVIVNRVFGGVFFGRVQSNFGFRPDGDCVLLCSPSVYLPPEVFSTHTIHLHLTMFTHALNFHMEMSLAAQTRAGCSQEDQGGSPGH